MKSATEILYGLVLVADDDVCRKILLNAMLHSHNWFEPWYERSEIWKFFEE